MSACYATVRGVEQSNDDGACACGFSCKQNKKQNKKQTCNLQQEGKLQLQSGFL
jgi:hypothetical protein